MSLQEIVSRIEVLIRAILNSVLSSYLLISDAFSGLHSDLTDVSGNLTHDQIDAALATIPAPQIQSDWTQVDTLLLDFIKNKPVSVDQVQVDWDAVSGIASILHKPTIPAAQIRSNWSQTVTSALDYILNKPTIPAAQVQSDWTETNTALPSFILHKPTLSGAAQVPSDWNQTDSGAVDFILNKPVPTSSDASITIDGWDFILTVLPSKVIVVTLPVGTSVADRISGAVEITDYPTGWVLTAGANPNDIDIAHGLDRRVSGVMIHYLNGTAERQLFANAAFSGLVAADRNTLTIEGLATIAFPIIIHIIFA